MKKLLVISGPTATGKTKLALELARKFGGEIVSADSRQVFKDMDIGTGKDLPSKAKLKVQYSKLGINYGIGGVKVWGYDLVSPNEEFSVALYTKVITKVIEDIWQREKLPILVGGTGLYIKAIVDGLDTINIPKDEKLRKRLSGKSVVWLFDFLSRLNSVRAENLNDSDRKNSRRLIRAIEVSLYLKNNRGEEKLPVNRLNLNENLDVLMIGIIAPWEKMKDKITQRVKERIRLGFEKELKKLVENGVSWDSQAMQSLGYRQWQPFYKGKKVKSDSINNWIKGEIAYAKRQITWFKKDKRIQWFDISQPGFEKKIEKKVQKWYSKSR